MLLALLPSVLLIFLYFIVDVRIPWARLLFNLFIFGSMLTAIFKYYALIRLRNELMVECGQGNPKTILFEDLKK